MATHIAAINPNLKQLFKISAQGSRCDIIDTVELFEKNILCDSSNKKEYVLFRYKMINNQIPVRSSIKFNDLISVEVHQEDIPPGIVNSCGVNTGFIKMYITAVYKDIVNTQKFEFPCSSMSYILQLERELYKYFF